MKNLEKFSTLFLVAGLFSFLLAFLLLGVWPAIMTERMESRPLPSEIPAEFAVNFKTVEDYQAALLEGRDIYIKEACWHCHSQFVRPVGNESVRYGLVSVPGEYQNALSRPQLFGTRRVGPDLSREAGKRSNDWHFAHLYNPKLVEPESVMPQYSWYFDESTNPPTPKKGAVALVAYLQSLGAWTLGVKNTAYDLNEVTMPPSPSGE
jgi:cytochrome c oxidase cbb3-type subunit II